MACVDEHGQGLLLDAAVYHAPFVPVATHQCDAMVSQKEHVWQSYYEQDQQVFAQLGMSRQFVGKSSDS